MGIFHFLNVKQGDCSIIEHATGRVTVIDVSNARKAPAAMSFYEALAKTSAADRAKKGLAGNFNQKDYPVNPIEYMRQHNISGIFRFIATHPDMDHLDGIKDFFEAIPVINFWDTNNTCEKEFGNNSPYREEDWDFYTKLHENRVAGITRLALHAGDRGKYWLEGDNGQKGDGLHILAPTPALVSGANESGDHNDSSYVILYWSSAGKIIIAGDSHDETWKHIIENHGELVKDIDLLVAPHHGRHSDRDFSFLDVLRPKLTLFGNASSEHLAYGPWHSRGLPIITNNQANCVVVDTNGAVMQIYVTNESYAKSVNPMTSYSVPHRAYYLGQIITGAQQAAE